MAKTAKTAREIEIMIRTAEPHLRIAQFKVHKDPMGWSATVTGGADTAILDGLLKQTVDRLHELYDLQE